MRLFVTGASGYIGGGVVRAARAAGHDVVGVVRSAPAAAQLEATGCRAVVADVTDPAGYADALADVDVAIHTAVGAGGGVVTEQDDVAVTGMLDALAARPARTTFVLTSGLAVYTGVTGTLLDETTTLDTAAAAQQPRIALERRVVAARTGDLRTAVIRPAHVYGAGKSGIFTRMLLEASVAATAGVFVGDGTGLFGTVHVDDLARAYVALAEGDGHGTFNVVGQSLPLIELAQALGHAVGAGGAVTGISLDEAVAEWGPRAHVLLGTSPISSVRATAVLRWTPAAPSLAFELIHGSLRVADR